VAQTRSAGVLLYRRLAAGPEVLLVLPGGPFWRRRDAGAWQIPKGAIEPGEEPVAAAMRELGEELGIMLTQPPRYLCEVRQAGGKRVETFAAEYDWDVAHLVSAQVEIEWPPRSGRKMRIPEVAEARWFPLAEAPTAILPSQAPALDALAGILAETD
jgi:predicted NUDIX family NTP pyrophosphohydrolase